MPALRQCMLPVLAAILSFPLSASAGWVNELGRHTGLGWSDGYHAYEGCPDARLRSQPWQRRANRHGGYDEPLVPYLEPTPAPKPAPAKTSQAKPALVSVAIFAAPHIAAKLLSDKTLDYLPNHRP